MGKLDELKNGDLMECERQEPANSELETALAHLGNLNDLLHELDGQVTKIELDHGSHGLRETLWLDIEHELDNAFELVRRVSGSSKCESLVMNTD